MGKTRHIAIFAKIAIALYLGTVRCQKNLRSGREDSRLVLECYVTSYSWRHLHEVRYSLHVYMWCVSHETGYAKFRIHVHMSCVCSQHVHESVMIFVKVLRTS